MEKKSSWKTTTAGILTALAAVFGAVVAMIDGNPATNPDWVTVAGTIAVAWGLLSARDNNVTSEQAGAK